MELVRISKRLAKDVDKLTFGPPVTHVYNPLDYAWSAHESYLRRFGSGTREVVLVGMNPGPWGMAQTGIPFGEVGAVRDWLGVGESVGKPRNEHPKRSVQGLECKRSEVSGARLWGWARDVFGTPEKFFAQFFVTNYCPLAFLEDSGRNRTPDKLPADERSRLFDVCDRALREIIEELQPEHVIGVGVFAEKRATAALAGMGYSVGRILHPSPASPKANKGWGGIVHAELVAMDIRLPSRPGEPT